MIITRTPFRVSFVGGGSDLEVFYSKSIGAVLSVTINKFMYISSHTFFGNRDIRLKYSKTETVEEVHTIQHPIFREALNKHNVKGIEISSNGDIPAGTGLGSSSSFTVGLLHNLYAKKGVFVTKEDLAQEACEIEIGILGEPIGKQDQYAAAYGGLNIFEFGTEGVRVNPLHLKKEIYKRLQNNLLMFYTGRKRKAHSILKEQKENIENENEFHFLQKMVELVWDSRDALYSGDLNEFGKILHKNWQFKKKLAGGITDAHIDRIYKKALSNGAIGGKLLGAGGGGFLLFYCEREHQSQLRRAMESLKELKFKFDNEGSKILYASDEYI